MQRFVCEDGAFWKDNFAHRYIDNVNQDGRTARLLLLGIRVRRNGPASRLFCVHSRQRLRTRREGSGSTAGNIMGLLFGIVVVEVDDGALGDGDLDFLLRELLVELQHLLLAAEGAAGVGGEGGGLIFGHVEGKEGGDGLHLLGRILDDVDVFTHPVEVFEESIAKDGACIACSLVLSAQLAAASLGASLGELPGGVAVGSGCCFLLCSGFLWFFAICLCHF